jgi:hypothetical protein
MTDCENCPSCKLKRWIEKMIDESELEMNIDFETKKQREIIMMYILNDWNKEFLETKNVAIIKCGYGDFSKFPAFSYKQKINKINKYVLIIEYKKLN